MCAVRRGVLLVQSRHADNLDEVSVGTGLSRGLLEAVVGTRKLQKVLRCRGGEEGSDGGSAGRATQSAMCTGPRVGRTENQEPIL